MLEREKENSLVDCGDILKENADLESLLKGFQSILTTITEEFSQLQQCYRV